MCHLLIYSYFLKCEYPLFEVKNGLIVENIYFIGCSLVNLTVLTNKKLIKKDVDLLNDM